MRAAAILTTSAILLATGNAIAQTKIWGDGSVWTSDSVLPDFSFAGYRQGNVPLPEKSADVSVTDYGAKGDGETDCTDAFKRAIAESPGKTIGIPKGTYVISDRLSIDSPNTVLLGEGMEKTILVFTKGLQEIEPTSALTGGGFETNNWSWSGGLITLGKSSGAGKTAHHPIATSAKRGTRKLDLANDSDLEAGTTCLIRVTDPANNSLINYLYRNHPGDISLIKNKGISISQAVTIDSVEGNRITLRQPLRFEIRPDWKPVVTRFSNNSQEIGISNFTIRFPERVYRGHWMEDGLNGFEMRGTNNWARNIRIQNCDSGAFLYGAWCTVDGLLIESDREAHQSGNTGHHGISLQGRECVMANFSIDTMFFHDVTVSRGSVGNVFSKGSAVDMSIDHHRNAPYENLFTEIDVGIGTRVWSSGGTKGKGLHSASGATFWNIDSKERFSLPSEEFGPPGLVFVGLNLETVRSSDLPQGWHYERSRPSRLVPQNLYLAQVDRRKSSETAVIRPMQEIHKWTNLQGAVIEASFLGLENTTVKLKMRNGREYDYPLEMLDEASQALAKELGSVD